MSNRLNALLSRMPSHFAKDEDSNNYKLLSLIAQGSEETRAIYNTMLKFWDVDQSEGIGLDRLGKDEGISRGSWDDEEYRKMIKIQCIVNMSDGDIPTMNTILDAYMGTDFIGLQDGYINFEPASLVLHLNSASKRLPIELAKRIKPAGVKLHWQLNELIGRLKLVLSSYSFGVSYPFCNTFRTADLPGILAAAKHLLQTRSYHFDAFQPICGTFLTSTFNSSESMLNIELANEYRNVHVYYPRASIEEFVQEGD